MDHPTQYQLDYIYKSVIKSKESVTMKQEENIAKGDFHPLLLSRQEWLVRLHKHRSELEGIERILRAVASVLVQHNLNIESNRLPRFNHHVGV